MTAPDPRLQAAASAFSALHAADPTGQAGVYHDTLQHWVAQLDPEAPLAVRLAAMGQHVERWTIARTDYAQGRDGYRKWRSALSQLHARRCTEVLHAAGYDAATTARVAALVTKQRLRSDPDAGLLQDAVCLTFLALQLDDFARDRDTAQVVPILAKTWTKMTGAGHDAALALAPSLSPAAQTLIARALAEHG